MRSRAVHRHRSARSATAIVIAVVLALMVGTGPAFGHAALIETDPKDGATLDKEPGSVTFKFNQNIGTPAYVVVTAPDGSRVESGAPDVIDESVTEQVETTGLAGEYKASYRVVSADGHPVKGTITYEVTSGEKPDTSADTAAGAEQDQSFWQKYRTQLAIGLAGVILAALLLFWPRRKRHD